MSWWPKSRYTRHLEQENARLRAECRALLNSMLARSGFQPIAGDAQAELPKPVNVNPRARSMTAWAWKQTLKALQERVVPVGKKPDGKA